MSDIPERRHIIGVRERTDGFYLVWIAYYEDDAANAVGQILRTEHDRDGDFGSVLSTNDFLSPIWCSPQQSLWVGSANGNVWTTADVAWSPPRQAGLAYDVLDPSLTWRVTTLPDMRRLGYVPNVTALWGSADNDVHAGTYRGVMYRWDGANWTELYDATDAGVGRMHGLAADNVYAVGYDGLILRWDGVAWQRIAYPGGESEGQVITGVRVMEDEEVYMCTKSGRILRGGPDGFEVFCELPLALYGIAWFDGRILLAAGDSGMYELQGDKAVMIKDTFGCVDLYETSHSLFCIEPTQDVPSVIDYTPGAEPPWVRSTFV